MNHEALMDDLAYQIHEFLMEEATEYKGDHLVLIPVTAIVKKFGRNHRTIARRLSALKGSWVAVAYIKKDYTTLYYVKEEEEN